MEKRPAAIDLASWLLWLQVASGLVVSVLVVVFLPSVRKKREEVFVEEE